MSDMDVQIKITTDTKDAQKNVDSLSKSFENIEVITAGVSDSLKSASTSLNEVSDSTSQTTSQASEFEDAMNALEASINDAAGSMGDGAGSAEDFAKSFDEVEKKAKKLGRDLSTLVTAPIAALAALSLKNVFDLGSIEGSTGKVRSFALAVENMKRTFDEFLMDIGTIIAPAVEKMANALTNALRAFMSLDRGTKTAIISFSSFLAILGPLILAFSSITSLFIKLKAPIQAIAGFFGTISKSVTAVGSVLAALVFWLTSLGSVFVYLKKAGLGTLDALQLALTAFVRSFNAKLIAPILSSLGSFVQKIATLADSISPAMAKGLRNAGQGISEFSKELEKRFQETKGDLDKALASIGATSDDALTAGMSGALDRFKKWFNERFDDATSGSDNGVLNSEIGKNFEKQLQELKQLDSQFKLDMERAALDHNQRLQEIDQTADPKEMLQNRIQAEREFLAKRTELQREAADRELQNALIANQAITNVNQKAVADNEARNKNELENQKITNEQMLENTRLLNTQEEELYRIKYEKVKQYADIFADGLSESFITIAEGSKTLGAALEDFARQFLRQVAAMILRATILKAVMSSIGFTGPTASAPSSGAGYLGASTGFASGGPVIGAGSGTSDSIPAWLSNGEYVIDAKTVSRFGNGFFRGLQSLAKGGVPFSMPSSVPKFADGGLVTGSGQAPQVVIENNGSPKQVSSQEFDPKTAITTVILEDLGKNGPISRGYQNTFGMKRGGFA